MNLFLAAVGSHRKTIFETLGSPQIFAAQNPPLGGPLWDWGPPKRQFCTPGTPKNPFLEWGIPAKKINFGLWGPPKDAFFALLEFPKRPHFSNTGSPIRSNFTALGSPLKNPFLQHGVPQESQFSLLVSPKRPFLAALGSPPKRSIFAAFDAFLHLPGDPILHSWDPPQNLLFLHHGVPQNTQFAALQSPINLFWRCGVPQKTHFSSVGCPNQPISPPGDPIFHLRPPHEICRFNIIESSKTSLSQPNIPQ